MSSEGEELVVDVPALGDSITEATVSSWLKCKFYLPNHLHLHLPSPSPPLCLTSAPGDYVSADEVVLVLETDKVSVDVRTPVAGTLSDCLAEEDDVVNVGDALFKVQAGVGEAPADAGTIAMTPSPSPSPFPSSQWPFMP